MLLSVGFPGKNTGVGSHFLLQGIFPAQRWNQGLSIASRFFTIWATREALLFITVWHLSTGEGNGTPLQCSCLEIPWAEEPGYLLLCNICQLGEGNGTSLRCSCLENPLGRGAWWAVVHGVAKSRTWLSDFTFTFHFHTLEKEMATHSSVLAWRIPGMAEPGGLLSVGSHRVRHDWSDLAAAAAAPTFVNKLKKTILKTNIKT